MNNRDIVLTTSTSSGHALVMTEHYMKSWDKAVLYYRAWHRGSPGHKAIVVLHGNGEDSSHYLGLSNQLGLEDASVFAWDLRGHGRSGGEPGYARRFDDLVEDAQSFVKVVSVTYGIALQDMIVLGQGLGGVILSAWLHDHKPDVGGAILLCPAFGPRLGVPLPRATLHLLRRADPEGYVRLRPRGPAMVDDRCGEQQPAPAFAGRLGVRLLASLFDTAKRVLRGAGRITTPTLILSGGSDRFARLRPQRRYFEKLGASYKRMEVFPGLSHRLLQDGDRFMPILHMRQFIREILASPCRGSRMAESLP